LSVRPLVVVDAVGHILDRLARSWTAHHPGTFGDVVDSARHHPYVIRRDGAAAGMIVWLDPLPFIVSPRAATVPQIVVVHHIAGPELAAYQHALPHADAIATVSLRWRRRLRELTGREAWLLPHGIDTARFHPLDDGAEARRRFGIADGAFVVGFSAKAKANAYGRKGVDLLREALRAARDEWPELVLLLIGSGWETLAAELRADGIAVIRHEPAAADDTAEIYPLMDVFLCTSSEEGGPATILEAMACAVPVIATDVGHVPEVVEDGVTGWIVRTREAGEIVARMRALHGAMGRAARDFVVAGRDEHVVVPRIDFRALFAEAAERFARRGAAERFLRRAHRGYLGVRYAARSIAR